ncbi:MAG: PIN domain-containing protein [Acidobacteriales bacterium]|nr:PIN domain-containing protein [Terriglobales bacterium]
MILVDTSVWSLALRREGRHLREAERTIVAQWAELVREGRVHIIGPIRQELLSGLKATRQFVLLEQHLRCFPDAPVASSDYIDAARFYNLLRGKGVTGTGVDLLICAVAARNGWPIFTVDADFTRYAEHLPIRLFRAPISSGA